MLFGALGPRGGGASSSRERFPGGADEAPGPPGDDHSARVLRYALMVLVGVGSIAVLVFAIEGLVGPLLALGVVIFAALAIVGLKSGARIGAWLFLIWWGIVLASVGRAFVPEAGGLSPERLRAAAIVAAAFLAGAFLALRACPRR